MIGSEFYHDGPHSVTRLESSHPHPRHERATLDGQTRSAPRQMTKSLTEPSVTKTRMYYLVSYAVRAYMAIVILAGIYSAFWLLEVAGYLDQRILGAVWIAIVSMGISFLVLLIPMLYYTRSDSR